MIFKKDLTNYDVATFDELFDLLYDLYVSGRFDLFNTIADELSKKQKEDAYDYIYLLDEEYSDLVSEIINCLV